MERQIEQICDTELCTGCYTCAQICRHNAIIMSPDNEGFYRPIIDLNKCVGCGVCQLKCPVNNPVLKNDNPITVYSGWSCNDATRINSSSGGVFSEVATYFLNNLNGVVFGVIMNEKKQAVHTCIECVEDLYKMRGSKYIQSIVGDSYAMVKKYLEQEKHVLFSGTPCQIAGLLNFLGKTYDNLFTIDVLCHGVPSQSFFNSYIEYISKKINDKVDQIKFRCKKRSWRFYNIGITSHSESEKSSNGITYDYEGHYYSDPYIRAFLRNYILRPSCYKCEYASMRRVGDLTLGDWWGYKPFYGEKHDYEEKGVSLVLCNTEKAKSLIASCKIIKRLRTVSEAKKTNVSLNHPTNKPDDRELFWIDFSKLTFDQMINKWLSPEILSPSRYIRYRMRNSFVRRMVVGLFVACEKVVSLMGIDCTLIKTKK